MVLAVASTDVRWLDWNLLVCLLIWDFEILIDTPLGRRFLCLESGTRGFMRDAHIYIGE